MTRSVLLDGLGFPEGARWHDGRLWFCDLRTALVRAVEVGSGRVEEIAHLADQPAGLGWLPDGSLLVTSMLRRKLLAVGTDGLLVDHVDLAPFSAHPVNDMVVDESGRAYVGAFGFDVYGGAPRAPGPLLMVEPSGAVTVAAAGLDFPNGAVILPGTRTIVVAETWGARLTAFDVQDSGALTNRRVWAELPGLTPDGICADAVGGVWVGSVQTAAFVRVLEGGQISDRVPVPGRMALDCALGGEDGHQLFLLTASSSQGTGGGAIEAMTVKIPGSVPAKGVGANANCGTGHEAVADRLAVDVHIGANDVVSRPGGGD